MDILLSSFVNMHISNFDEKLLIELDKFLSFEDEVILNFYHHDIIENQIDKNAISKILKNSTLMAERVGFEPTNELPRCWFSRPVLSTAQPPLQIN